MIILFGRPWLSQEARARLLAAASLAALASAAACALACCSAAWSRAACCAAACCRACCSAATSGSAGRAAAPPEGSRIRRGFRRRCGPGVGRAARLRCRGGVRPGGRHRARRGPRRAGRRRDEDGRSPRSRPQPATARPQYAGSTDRTGRHPCGRPPIGAPHARRRAPAQSRDDGSTSVHPIVDDGDVRVTATGRPPQPGYRTMPKCNARWGSKRSSCSFTRTTAGRWRSAARSLTAASDDQLTGELQREQVETGTRPCRDLSELDASCAGPGPGRARRPTRPAPSWPRWPPHRCPCGRRSPPAPGTGGWSSGSG